MSTRFPIRRDAELPAVDDLCRLLADNEFRPMPPFTDRAAWTSLANRPWLAETIKEAFAAAEQAVATEAPRVLPTDVLAFYRTGSRDPYAERVRTHSAALASLTLAECTEGQGRFIDALLDWSWAICEETSWCMSAHLDHWQGPDSMLPDISNPSIDLRVAGMGQILAQSLYLLRPVMDDLSPYWSGRIQYELRRQVIDPFLSKDFGWLHGTNNWNAVCNAGVTTAVLMGDFDTQTRAEVLHKVLEMSLNFLSGFAPDGGCSEGPGYWVYGVTNYCLMAYYVRCATGGQVDMLADPVVARFMAYPPCVVLTRPLVANFADCSRSVRFGSGVAAWAAGETGQMVSRTLFSCDKRARRFDTLVLDAWLASEPEPFEPPSESFLPDLQQLVVHGEGTEGDQLVLAVKGGHNGEHHNHNDVGNFIVHLRGRTLITDLGAGRYTRDFFSGRRYRYITTRSNGHAVPRLNGYEQPAGSEYSAGDFQRIQGNGASGVRMDIAGAYPEEATVVHLWRTVLLEAGSAERVSLVDEIEFADGPGMWELPLYSEGRFSPVEQGAVCVEQDGVAMRIEWDAELIEASIDAISGEDISKDPGIHSYARCTLKLRRPACAACVRLAFVPQA